MIIYQFFYFKQVFLTIIKCLYSSSNSLIVSILLNVNGGNNNNLLLSGIFPPTSLTI